MLEHLIVDSGAIIKGCGYEFHKTSKRFWTVQDVINEIRDSKSLHLLETLPFELEIR
jgi:rRNA maturation endonuclease Nob1